MKLFQFLVAALLLVSYTAQAQEPPDPTPGATKPVREQNLDANDWIAVHEQGTANVEVQGTADVNVTGGSIDANVTGGSIDANISGGSVTVDNTDSNPVPVDVKNLPTQQDVWVDGGVMTPVTRAYYDFFNLDHDALSGIQPITGGPILATLIYVSHNNDKVFVRFFSDTLAPAGLHQLLFIDASEGGGPDHIIPLMYPVEIDGFEIKCLNVADKCEVNVTVVGF
jgi:hypothetical protein